MRTKSIELANRALTENFSLNCVYCFYNRKKHKVYIGSTENPHYRFIQHLSCDGDEFHKDLSESIDDFEIRIDIVCKTREEAWFREQEAIWLANEESEHNKLAPKLYNKHIPNLGSLKMLYLTHKYHPDWDVEELLKTWNFNAYLIYKYNKISLEQMYLFPKGLPKYDI